MTLLLRPAGWILALSLLAAFAGATPAHAQEPTQRQIRTYIPPDQLVSFLPSTPFDQFVDLLGPIFERETGKQVVDAFGVEGPIGIPIARAHFFDAFELVLNYHGLTYRETERHFLIEQAPEAPALVQTAAEARAQTTAGAQTTASADLPTLGTREIQINAVLFELNHTRARSVGIDWNVLFGGTGGAGGGAGGGGEGGGEVTFNLNTARFFESLELYLDAPDQISFTTLTQLFRFLETEGVGETIANPTVTVQSGQQGRIQIGSDVPVQTRDFSGNTVTQFFSTGIIIDVTPTVITEALADTAGAPVMDFIHLDVQVENSGSRPSAAGLIIDRNQVATQVMLLDGEQTAIGGLFSTDETVERRGVPFLKDLPGWFFGLRYLFGFTHRVVTQNEMIIVLQAQMLDPLPARARRPSDGDMIERRRRQVEENLRRVGIEGQTVRVPGPSKR